jgi:hypothetical protein
MIEDSHFEQRTTHRTHIDTHLFSQISFFCRGHHGAIPYSSRCPLSSLLTILTERPWCSNKIGHGVDSPT